jgi:NAD(P)-dependent dehydrogenase (short-subunit alcohol dehydrogenase family)
MSSVPLSAAGVAILGGTAGVGLEAAAQFAEAGSRVVLFGRNAERGAAACAACRSRVPAAEVSFVLLDAMDPDATAEAELVTRHRLGTIDVLVNTTGPSRPPALLHTIPAADALARIDELAGPPVHMTMAVLPDMRARRSGSIVTVASDAAKVATPGESLIGAAMAAIVMFSRTAALEAKREGVRINVITPSLIANTPGAAFLDADPFSARLFAKAKDQAHLGVVEPEDIAATILFLAGPTARRITGQVISVNGGISVG